MGKTTAKPKNSTKPTGSAAVRKASRATGRKASGRKSASAPTVYYDSTPEYVRTTLEAFAENDRRLKADPSEARRILIKMGLMTKGGKLTKRYGG